MVHEFMPFPVVLLRSSLAFIGLSRRTQCLRSRRQFMCAKNFPDDSSPPAASSESPTRTRGLRAEPFRTFGSRVGHVRPCLESRISKLGPNQRSPRSTTEEPSRQLRKRLIAVHRMGLSKAACPRSLPAGGHCPDGYETCGSVIRGIINSGTPTSFLMGFPEAGRRFDPKKATVGIHLSAPFGAAQFTGTRSTNRRRKLAGNGSARVRPCSRPPADWYEQEVGCCPQAAGPAVKGADESVRLSRRHDSSVAAPRRRC